MAPSVQSFINTFNNNIEPPIRKHLVNVYACLTASTLAAAVGSAVHIYTDIFRAGFLTSIAAVAFFFLLMSSADDEGKQNGKRISYLLGFSFCSGIGMGPLLEHVMFLEPSIITTALIGTSVVFISFSLCSMLAPQGKWLFLGGPLMTAINTLFLMSLTNLFFGSQMLFRAELYLGLLAMCGFVLYDTQMIIERRRMGSKDFVTHALNLFIDFVGIFKRLLILLSERETQESRKRRKQ